MKSELTLLAVAALSLSIHAAIKPPKPEPTIEQRKAANAEREARYLKEEGGEVIRPGTMKGFLLIGNAQKTVDQFEIEETRDYFWFRLNYNIKVAPSEPATPANASALLAESGAAAAVFLTEDATLPILLVSPEDHWAIVNVTRLKKDAKTPKYVTMRTKKELVRAIVHCFGGNCSSYEGSILSAIKEPSDLDRYAGYELPEDVFDRFRPYLSGLGLTPAERMSFLCAAYEPWCPPPTNEYQKAIWEKIQNKKADAADPTNRWKRDFPDKEKPKAK